MRFATASRTGSMAKTPSATSPVPTSRSPRPSTIGTPRRSPRAPTVVRVEASDEAANPPDRTFRHALESSVFVIDNTPPVFRSLAAQGRRVHGDAVDGVGPIARIDVSVDGRSDWHPYLPVDGVFDESVEAFDFDVSPFVPTGNHLVAVRVFDQSGNSVVRDVEVK